MWPVFLVSMLSPLGSHLVLPSGILLWICALPPVFSNLVTFPGNYISSHMTRAFLRILIRDTVSFLLPRLRLRMTFLGFPRANILLAVSHLSYCWPRMGRMNLS